MEVSVNVFLSEGDVRKIIKHHLENSGYRQISDIEIITRSKKDIPEGATMGDCIGINAKVEKCPAKCKIEDSVILTPEKIISGNIKIGVFMELDFSYWYHKDWSHLMPVVSKINKLLIGDVASGSFIPESRIKEGLCAVDIMKVWHGVLDYIDYYNNKTKNEKTTRS